MGESSARTGAERIAGLTGRLQLYVSHLAGPALRRRVDLLDLVQDAQLRALGSPRAEALEGEELWRFVRAVARNTVVDAARQARRLPRRASSLAPAGEESSASGPIRRQAAPQPGPRTLAAAAEDERRLQTAFEALSPEHRRVIGLRRLEGLSAAETGRRMGRSEAAVHSLYRRALTAWAEASGAQEAP